MVAVFEPGALSAWDKKAKEKKVVRSIVENAKKRDGLFMFNISISEILVSVDNFQTTRMMDISLFAQKADIFVK